MNMQTSNKKTLIEYLQTHPSDEVTIPTSLTRVSKGDLVSLAEQVQVSLSTETDAWDTVENTPEQTAAEEPAVRSEKKKKSPRQRRFSDEEILEMISMFHDSHWTKSRIAKHFECSGTFIHNVLQGNVYKDITAPGE